MLLLYAVMRTQYFGLKPVERLFFIKIKTKIIKIQVYEEFHNESMTVAIDKWLLILQWDENQKSSYCWAYQSILASSSGSPLISCCEEF